MAPLSRRHRCPRPDRQLHRSAVYNRQRLHSALDYLSPEEYGVRSKRAKSEASGTARLTLNHRDLSLISLSHRRGALHRSVTLFHPVGLS